MAPYVYKVEANPELFKPGDSAALGLSHNAPTWYFTLSLVNLTDTETGPIDVKATYELAGVAWGVIGLSTRLLPNPASVLEPKTAVFPDGKTGILSVGLPSIMSGHAHTLQIFIQTDIRPMTKDFEFTIHCAEGDFQLITPTEWNNIGWSSKTE